MIATFRTLFDRVGNTVQQQKVNITVTKTHVLILKFIITQAMQYQVIIMQLRFKKLFPQHVLFFALGRCRGRLGLLRVHGPEVTTMVSVGLQALAHAFQGHEDYYHRLFFLKFDLENATTKNTYSSPTFRELATLCWNHCDSKQKRRSIHNGSSPPFFFSFSRGGAVCVVGGELPQPSSTDEGASVFNCDSLSGWTTPDWHKAGLEQSLQHRLSTMHRTPASTMSGRSPRVWSAADAVKNQVASATKFEPAEESVRRRFETYAGSPLRKLHCCCREHPTSGGEKSKIISSIDWLEFFFRSGPSSRSGRGSRRDWTR